MSLNKRRVARSRQTSSMQGGQFGRLKDGKNTLRIFSFPHKITEIDFDSGFYAKVDGYKPGEEFDEIERTCSVHFLEEGMINCLGKGCPYCAESQKYLDSKEKRDQKLGKDLRANRRFYVNAVDMDSTERTLQVWGLPSTVFNDIISYVDDPEYGEAVLGCKGRDFIIERDSKADPAKMYNVKLRDANRCDALDPAVQDDVQDLFRCTALNPGWSSKSELNQSTATPETDAEKVDRARDSKSRKDKRSNDYKDEGDTSAAEEKSSTKNAAGEAAPPWEKPGANAKPEIAVGTIVSFKEGTDVFEGPVESIADNVATIKADGSLWDIPFEECTIVKKESAPARRRRA